MIYRLNTIGVVVGGCILLHEPIDGFKIGGVGMGIVAVGVMFVGSASTSRSDVRIEAEDSRGLLGDDNPGDKELTDLRGDEPEIEVSTVCEKIEPKVWEVRSAYLVAIAAAVMRASYGLVTKHAIREGATPDLLVLAGAGGWVLCGTVWALGRDGIWRTHQRAKLPFTLCIGLGMISGCLTCGNILFLTKALEQGDASTLVPIANTSFLCTMAMSVSARMEQCDCLKLAAAVAAVACIGLLAGSSVYESHLHGVHHA